MLSPEGGGSGEAARLREPARDPGHRPRRGTRLCRRLRAEAGRHRGFVRENEPGARDQRRRWRRGGAAGRDHGRVPGAGAPARAALSARPGEPEGMLARRQRRDQRGRAALPEVRRHAPLRPRAAGRAGRRDAGPGRRPDAKEQKRLRPRRHLRRLGGPARPGDRDHAAADSRAARPRRPLRLIRRRADRGGLRPARLPGRLPALRDGARRPLHARGGEEASRRGNTCRRVTRIC